MISRIATFPPLPPEQDAAVRRNVRERFMAALRAQEGFIAGYWLTRADRSWVSVSVWASEEAQRRGGERANATPLLPGQDPATIPAPATVETYEVFAQTVSDDGADATAAPSS